MQSLSTFSKKLLQKHPALLKKYVNLGLVTAYVVTKPIGVLMRHLMCVQDLDLDGPTLSKQFQSELDLLFSGYHSKAYAKHIDHNWAAKQCLAANKDRDSSLSQKEFMAITDLSNLQDTPPEVAVASKTSDSPFTTDDLSPSSPDAEVFFSAITGDSKEDEVVSSFVLEDADRERENLSVAEATDKIKKYIEDRQNKARSKGGILNGLFKRSPFKAGK